MATKQCSPVSVGKQRSWHTFDTYFGGNNIPRKNRKSEVFTKKQSWQSLFLHRLMAAVPQAPVCPFPCLDKDRGRPGSLLANSSHCPLLFLPLEGHHSQSHLYSFADLAKTSENTYPSKVWPPFFMSDWSWPQLLLGLYYQCNPKHCLSRNMLKIYPVKT